ncbi:hypothetical protein [Hydrococcus rivularis]|uniref:hypothetical protein n=1 Tax=Hydrococcus rivularis TaxID=1616834 RepID=UPI000AF3B94A|nr:hypothetical protein [Hydrococcus rivularis]
MMPIRSSICTRRPSRNRQIQCLECVENDRNMPGKDILTIDYAQVQLHDYSDGLARHKLRLVIDYINSNLNKDLRLMEIANLLDLTS